MVLFSNSYPPGSLLYLIFRGTNDGSLDGAIYLFLNDNLHGALYSNAMLSNELDLKFRDQRGINSTQ